MVDAQTISIIFAGVSIGVAAIYYSFTIRNQNKTRQAQILMGLYDTYRSKEFRKQSTSIRRQEYADLDEWWSKYGRDGDPDEWASWLSVGAYYNGIGVLVKKGLIDLDLVDELLSNVVFGMYSSMEKPLMWWRKRLVRQLTTHDLFEGFEYLYNELKKRAKPLGPTDYDQNL